METETDKFGREIFANQIFKAIEDNHAKDSSSYIFGISGNWGEGKTHLLKLIETKLNDANFTVIWFSPWKYADDKHSVMRKFISLLNNRLPILKVNLDDFEKDQTSFKINKKILFLYLIFIFILLLIKSYVAEPYGNYLPDLSGLLVLLAIPVITALVGQVIAFQNSVKAVATVDGFDDRLNKVLKRYKLLRKQIVVFVDDLDRVSDDEARDVLNALRTFFDKPQITYVVTGDNKILESAVGRGLSTQGAEEQAEEGRRFLKKIFNVYWRMPLPAKWRMKAFIESKLGDILSESEKTVFTEWLIKYFELNPRNIERFIDSFKFNISSLTEEKDSLAQEDEEKKGQINEVLNNKLLLARAQIIQEKAYALYENIVRMPSYMKTIDKAIDEGVSDLSGVFQGVKITQSQSSFLTTFLAEEPRFYQNGGALARVEPFFRLVADIGLADDRGVTVENFEKFLMEGESVKIAQWLSITNNLSELVDATQRIVEAETTADLKRVRIDTILSSLDKENNSEVIEKFFSKLGSTMNDVLKTSGLTDAPESYQKIFNILSKVSYETSREISKGLTFVNSGDFNLVKEPLGRNATVCVLDWVRAYMNQDLWDAIKHLDTMSSNVDSERIGRYFKDDIEDVLNSFIAAPPDVHEIALRFLQKVPKGVFVLKKRLALEFNSITPDQQSQIISLVKNNYGNKTWGKKRVKAWLADK